MQQPLRHPFVLVLACIHETIRQTSLGPTALEIQGLLSKVYGITTVTQGELYRHLATLSTNHIEVDRTTGRYYINPEGLDYFNAIEHRIIPPQTVALQSRRQT